MQHMPPRATDNGCLSRAPWRALLRQRRITPNCHVFDGDRAPPSTVPLPRREMAIDLFPFLCAFASLREALSNHATEMATAICPRSRFRTHCARNPFRQSAKVGPRRGS
jgi:hypothetical protein